MPEDSDEAIWHYLSQYYQMPAPSPISQALCQLIAEYATGDDDTHSMPQLLAKFLSRELRYHRQVQELPDREMLRAADLKSLAGKRGIALRDMIEQAESTAVETHSGEIARQLLLAECYQHIQQPDKVVAHLETAVEDGAEDPVVYFALGYNRYRLAIESFAEVPPIAEHNSGVQIVSFQRACLQAVSAFENALTGHQSDGEVYEWIARVLKAAGFEDTADEAFDKADDLAYIDKADEVVAGLWAAEGWGQQPGSITQEEIDEFAELLKQSHDITELLPDSRQEDE
jgi:tetratricopeptide (TPR) repeat protein